ncbi:hypothetical protein Tco_0837310 [Tanacetum coccineum]
MKRRLFKGRVESSGDDLDEEDSSKQERESDKTKSMFQDSDFDVLDDDMNDVEGEIIHTATTRVSTVSAPFTTAGVAISTAELRTPPTTAATAFIDEDLTIVQTLIKMKEDHLIYQDQLQCHNAYALFAARLQQEEREGKIRSKPPTKTQLRNIMITYLKNMGKFNHNQLKGKSYKELQRLYEREQKKINDFVPMDFEKEEKKSVEPESEGKKSKRIKRVAYSALK